MHEGRVATGGIPGSGRLGRFGRGEGEANGGGTVNVVFDNSTSSPLIAPIWGALQKSCLQTENPSNRVLFSNWSWRVKLTTDMNETAWWRETQPDEGTEDFKRQPGDF